jgi:hypothetical protein
MADKFVTENRTGLWNNDRKMEEWQDDFRSKIYIKEPGWHWIGAREGAGEGKPALTVEVRKMDNAQVNQYCGEYTVLTKEQAKEKYSKSETPGASRQRTDKELDDTIPF